MMKLKNIKPGNKIFISLFFFYISLYFFFTIDTKAEERILSSPLINLNELKPSFEDEEDLINNTNNKEIIKNRKSKRRENSSSVKLIGLDKITAKTSEIIINLGETKKFGPLEIKALKCGRINSNNIDDSVAYLQVKDISENENDKVFIFNGWTFSSDPSLAPFDHAIYDLQLVNCNKV